MTFCSALKKKRSGKALLEAHANLLGALGENHEQVSRVATYLADLYEAWHAGAPGKGYDAKAEEWRAKLPNKQPTAP